MDAQETIRNHARTLPADVVVVGGGLAGFAAALEAAAHGAEVIVLEKGAEPGGSTVKSGGSFAFADTPEQRAQGIEDSPEKLRQDLLQGGGDECDPDLVNLYVEHQLEAREWLLGYGVTFDQVSLSGNQSVPRSHGVYIRDAFELLVDAVQSNAKIHLLRNAAANRLWIEDTRIQGVIGKHNGGPKQWQAPTVVLASGGFTRGLKAIRTFVPKLLHARPMGGELNTGDGLYMAMAAGADLCDIGSVKGTFGVSAQWPWIPDEPTLLNALYRGGIAVNKDGKRFVDESLSYKLIGDVCLEQPDAVGIQIFDEKVMQQTISGKLVNNYRGALKKGYVLQANTLEELATLVGISPGQLVETVRRYNEYARTGKDLDFGRASVSAGYGGLPTISEAPFYAFPSTTGMTSTYGGLKVDTSMRVQHVHDEFIPGLFAAGEIVGGFHGNSYMSGSSLGKSVIFGRVAGQEAALFSKAAASSNVRH